MARRGYLIYLIVTFIYITFKTDRGNLSGTSNRLHSLNDSRKVSGIHVGLTASDKITILPAIMIYYKCSARRKDALQRRPEPADPLLLL